MIKHYFDAGNGNKNIEIGLVIVNLSWTLYAKLLNCYTLIVNTFLSGLNILLNDKI